MDDSLTPDEAELIACYRIAPPLARDALRQALQTLSTAPPTLAISGGEQGQVVAGSVYAGTLNIRMELPAATDSPAVEPVPSEDRPLPPLPWRYRALGGMVNVNDNLTPVMAVLHILAG